MTEQERVALGIDVGTTAVKCALVDTQSRVLLTSASEKTCGYDTASDAGHAEQRVESIFQAVEAALRRLPQHLLKRIISVGICGQMHGIVWWRAAEVVAATRSVLEGHESDTVSSAWSRLVTWEDQRCSPQFLRECEQRIQATVGAVSSPLSSGYGLATFAHAVATDPQSVVGYDSCGTIHDLLAFVLCGHSTPEHATMDTTDAFSWGGFDIHQQTWSAATIQALGIRDQMLPQIKKPGSIIGNINSNSGFTILPDGVSVYVPMGDHPCSVTAATRQLSEDSASSSSSLSLVNIGTSAQLAIILPARSIAETLSTTGSRSFEIRPFIDDAHVLGVAAALSGGNMFAWLVERTQQWMRELMGDTDIEEAVVYVRLIQLGLEKLDTELQFSPTLNGERTSPDKRGCIDHLHLHNGSLGDLSAALCRGLIQNLVEMVPEQLQGSLRSSSMIGTGNALLRNAILQHFLGGMLHDASALRLQDAADAAVGAALVPGFLNLQ